MGGKVYLCIVVIAVIHGCAGIGEDSGDEALRSSHVGLVAAERQACDFRPHGGVQVLLKFVPVHVPQELRRVHLLHVLGGAGVGRGRELSGLVALVPFGVARVAVLAVVHGQGVWAAHVTGQGPGLAQLLHWGQVSVEQGVAVVVLRGILGYSLRVVGVRWHHVAFFLGVRREKDGIILHNIQGGGVWRGQVVGLIVGPHARRVPVVAELRQMARDLVAALVVVHAQVFHTHSAVAPQGWALVVRHAVHQEARLQPLDPLNLLPPSRPVLVVGMVLHVLHPQTLGLLHKWALVSDWQCFPRFS